MRAGDGILRRDSVRIRLCTAASAAGGTMGEPLKKIFEALRSPGHWRGAEPGFNVDQSIRAGRSWNKKASKCYNNVFNRSSNRYRNKFGRLRQHCFIHRCNPNDHKLFYQDCLSSSPANLKSNAKAPPYGFIHTEEPSVLRIPVSRSRSEHNGQQHLERFLPKSASKCLQLENDRRAAAVQPSVLHLDRRSVDHVPVAAVRCADRDIRRFGAQREYAEELLAVAAALKNGDVVFIVCRRAEPVPAAKLPLHLGQTAQQRTEVVPGLPLERLLFQRGSAYACSQTPARRRAALCP